MGEASNKGSFDDRRQLAMDRKENIEKAISGRVHADGVTWLVIQCAESVPLAEQVEGTEVRYEPDRENWLSLMPHDVPEWIQEEGVVKELMEGVELCRLPSLGGRWYRGVIYTPEEEKADRVLN